MVGYDGTPVQKREYKKMSYIITKPMALLYCAKKMEVGGRDNVRSGIMLAYLDNFWSISQAFLKHISINVGFCLRPDSKAVPKA
jgi:hypothetical protein